MRTAFCVAAALVASGLIGCAGPGDEEGMDAPAEAPAVTAQGDALAPEVFSFSGEGLWDGRPSLGGVWVAHPDVDAPGRVLIRHRGTGAEVAGALFRRETGGAGPPLQISSDAAEALGLVAGQPAPLDVTAVIRAPDAGAEPAEAAPSEEGPPEEGPSPDGAASGGVEVARGSPRDRGP